MHSSEYVHGLSHTHAGTPKMHCKSSKSNSTVQCVIIFSDFTNKEGLYMCNLKLFWKKTVNCIHFELMPREIQLPNYL